MFALALLSPQPTRSELSFRVPVAINVIIIGVGVSHYRHGSYPKNGFCNGSPVYPRRLRLLPLQCFILRNLNIQKDAFGGLIDNLGTRTTRQVVARHRVDESGQRCRPRNWSKDVGFTEAC